MSYKFKVGQRVGTRNNESGIIEKVKNDEYGNSCLVKIGDLMKWVNEDHLHESLGENQEYLVEG